MRTDLHTHSNYSDGELPPREIVALAESRGLAILGITDHDTAEHFEDCLSAGENSGLRVIPGVEFSTRFADMELHILGYGVDHKSPELLEHVDMVRNRRIERAREILDLLSRRNVRIPESELEEVPSNQTMGRVLIARMLYNYGYVRTIDEAFDRYLGTHASAFVPYTPCESREVVELIDRCGGVSVFAHPSRNEIEAAFEPLCEAGLQGIEVWRPTVHRNAAAGLKKRADSRGLVVTAGSDWHYEGGRLDLGKFYVDSNRVGAFLGLLESRTRERG